MQQDFFAKWTGSSINSQGTFHMKILLCICLIKVFSIKVRTMGKVMQNLSANNEDEHNKKILQSIYDKSISGSKNSWTHIVTLKILKIWNES